MNDLWTSKTNEELHEMIQRKNIRFNQPQGLKWLGHAERMPKEKEVTRIYKWKSLASRQIGSQRTDGKMI
jgi:hypothetical protein